VIKTIKKTKYNIALLLFIAIIIPANLCAEIITSINAPMSGTTVQLTLPADAYILYNNSSIISTENYAIEIKKYKAIIRNELVAPTRSLIQGSLGGIFIDKTGSGSVINNSGSIEGNTGIISNGDFVTLNNNSEGSIQGIDHAIYILGGAALTNFGNITGTSDNSNGIYSSGKPIKIINNIGGNIQGKSEGIRLFAGGNINNYGNITGTGAGSSGLYIYDGLYTLTSGYGSVIQGNNYGIRMSAATLTVHDMLIAAGNTQAILLENTSILNLPDNYIYWTNTETTDNSATVVGTLFTAGSNNPFVSSNKHKFVKIQEINPANYSLIFDVNKGKFYLDINHNTVIDNDEPEYTGQSDKWSFRKNILTLNGFKWVTQADYALAIAGNITLNLKDINNFSSTYTKYNVPKGITTTNTDKNNLKITGNGELNLYGVATDFVGIYYYGNLTINGGTINTAGGSDLTYGSGVRLLSGNMNITGGTLNASGGAYGIYLHTGVGLTITGGTVTAQGEISAFNREASELPTAYSWEKSENYNGSPSITGKYPSATIFDNNSDNPKFIKIKK